MKTVKAKFVCTGFTPGETNKTFYLSAVSTGSEENKAFAKLTPTGHITIGIDNDAPAADFFETQKEYFLTFEVSE